MLKLIIILSIGILTSCSKGQRAPSSVEDMGRVEIYQVGEIKISLLSVEKFRSLYGEAWVLMDGSNQEGTLFAQLTGRTSVPDARGAFLRMQNNGRSDGNQNPEEKKLGDFQADEFKSHNHDASIGGGAPGGGFNGPGVNKSYSFTTANRGGAETRPKNITVNYFVKVRACTLNEDPCL